MEAYLDGIPRSASTSSLNDGESSPRTTSIARPTTWNGGSSYWLTGISSVWSGLKAAAGVEVRGFLDAVHSTPDTPSTSSMSTGDKRTRSPTTDDARNKRRRTTLEPAEPDPSYARQLLQWARIAPPPTKTPPKGIRSLSGKRRLDANGGPSTDSGATTATSSATSSTPSHLRDRSSAARKPREQVGTMLVGSIGCPKQEVNEKDRTKAKTGTKTVELEDQVTRRQLSSKARFVPLPVPIPSKSPLKSTRYSAPPAPPTPPPPPGPGTPRVPSFAHPVLFSARASLRSTPPRPTQKRRVSAIGGVPDMDAFLGELGEKRGKLRKVGLPTRERHAKKEEGHLSEAVQKAFARKFAKNNGLASPSFDDPLQVSKSSSDLQRARSRELETSTLATSHSRPAQISSHLPQYPPPAPPVCYESESIPTPTLAPPPRSSSLASTETIVFGQALTIDENARPVNAGPGNMALSSRPKPHASTCTTCTPRSPSTLSSSLPTALPESSHTLSSVSPRRQASATARNTVSSRSTETIDDHVATNLATTARSTPDSDSAATKRLSAARKRTSLERLPGLDVGARRPTTPGRSKRDRRASSGGTIGRAARSSPSSSVRIVDRCASKHGSEPLRPECEPCRREEEVGPEFSSPSVFLGTGTKDPRT